MTRTYLSVLLALSALAVPPSAPFAQTATQDSIQDGTMETCRARAGGSRMRANNCEEERSRTVRNEHEVTVKVELPALSGPQCEASALTNYSQRNTTARITGTVSIASCPAGTTGSFTLIARVRDESGEIRSIEFSEAWQRDDAQDHTFGSDYPLGENTELVNVRVRNLTCTCAATGAPETTTLETVPQPAEPPLREL